jgi:hypothetical protein
MPQDDTLRQELLEMSRRDGELRDELACDGSLFGGYHDRMAALHRLHNQRLHDILEEHGWPGRSLVGSDGAAAAWLILQHAILDPALMRRALPLVQRAADAGECHPAHAALLIDRIRTFEGRPQVYGTQFDWDASGELSPLPIEDAGGVDARRRRVGLGPLEEQRVRLRDRAAAEGERPPDDHAARQRDADAWARSVGWR